VPHQAFGKVSIFYNFMLINKQWALTRPTDKSELLISNNLRLLKFVQLVMSKSIILSVKESTGVETTDTQLLDTQNKVKLTYKLIESELSNIDLLCLQKQQEWFQVELLDAVNEYLNIVEIQDEFVNAAYKSERDTLLIFQTTCSQHKTFIFKLLSSIDYVGGYDDIKRHLELAIKQSIVGDTRFVFADLNKSILKVLKNV
jgi:hypothetical protein